MERTLKHKRTAFEIFTHSMADLWWILPISYWQGEHEWTFSWVYAVRVQHSTASVYKKKIEMVVDVKGEGFICFLHFTKYCYV